MDKDGLILADDITITEHMMDVINYMFRKVTFGSMSKRDFIINEKHNLVILHTITCPSNIEGELSKIKSSSVFGK